MVSILSGPAHRGGDKSQAESLFRRITNVHFPRKSSVSYFSRVPVKSSGRRAIKTGQGLRFGNKKKDIFPKIAVLRIAVRVERGPEDFNRVKGRIWKKKKVMIIPLLQKLTALVLQNT